MRTLPTTATGTAIATTNPTLDQRDQRSLLTDPPPHAGVTLIASQRPERVLDGGVAIEGGADAQRGVVAVGPEVIARLLAERGDGERVVA